MDEVLDQAVELNDAPVETEEVEQVETETDATPEVDTGEQESTGQAPTDGPTLPKDVFKALKELRNNPELAKVARELNDTYGRAQAVIKDLGVKNLSQAVLKVREMASTI